MFEAQRPLFLRGLSLFHGWLPFLLLFLVKRLNNNPRAFMAWTFVAWTAMLISYFLLPPTGALLPNPQTPVNVNYVFGLSDTAPQKWMPGWAWLALMLTAMPLAIYLPTHALLVKLYSPSMRTVQ